MKHIAALVVALITSPVWAVNKCTDADGKVLYQHEACPQQGRKIELHNTTPSTGSDMSTEALLRDLKRLNEDYIKALKAAGDACGPMLQSKPTIGMSEADFLCTRPGLYGVTKVNQTITAGGVRKQYVMDHSDLRYVYVDNGVITAIQK